MELIDSLILVPPQDAAYHIELLSCTVFDHIASAAAAFRLSAFSAAACAREKASMRSVWLPMTWRGWSTLI